MAKHRRVERHVATPGQVGGLAAAMVGLGIAVGNLPAVAAASPVQLEPLPMTQRHQLSAALGEENIVDLEAPAPQTDLGGSGGTAFKRGLEFKQTLPVLKRGLQFKQGLPILKRLPEFKRGWSS